jgi:phage replication O-like protein O
MTGVAEVIQFPERNKVVKADIDDGWFKIANTLSLELCRVSMNDRERRVFQAVMHLTFSYRKSMDWIAAKQFEELTGIAENKISEIKNSLIARKILKTDGRKIGINTVVSEWVNKKRSAPKPKKPLPLERGKNTPKLENITPKIGLKHPKVGVHHKKDNYTQERKDIVELPVEQNPSSQIIDYLNLKTGKKFKCVKSHEKFINARLSEGYSVTDLMTVIDKKAIEWLNNPRMNQYLRPSTLFNSEKFDGYLNSEAAQPQVNTASDLNHDDESWADLVNEVM